MCVRQCYTLVDYLFMQNAVMNIINFTNEYLYSALYNIHCSRIAVQPASQPYTPYSIFIFRKEENEEKRNCNECELSRRDTFRHRFNVVIFRHWECWIECNVYLNLLLISTCFRHYQRRLYNVVSLACCKVGLGGEQKTCETKRVCALLVAKLVEA